MAARTPATILTENAGSLTLSIADFTGAATDDNDTWASGLTGVVGFWANATDDPTTNTHGVDLNLTTVATGLFTFRLGSGSRNLTVYVLSRL